MTGYSAPFLQAAPADCDPDRPGDLSIIVQGGLAAQNLFETAANVRHWRTLFPCAQIILALSGTTILEPTEALVEHSDVRLASPFVLDHQMRIAWSAIQRDCDALVTTGTGIPLPPIKTDTTLPNNINLQIAAAQAGLARAEGRYALRVRSDLIFIDRGFLEQYAQGVGRPRGNAATLRQRILISWIYTLNPFTNERLPLHFSDWFHFGVREDVADLWNVPEMNVHDATFYLAHAYSANSNAAERLFNTRLAVEQHLLVHALARDDAGLRLRYHNDADAAVRALALLADNFVLCDMKAATCVFPKYGEEFFNHRKPAACITPDDWQALVTMRHVDPRLILSGKIQQVHEPSYHEFRVGFPRRFIASQFATEIGVLSRGSIIAHGNGMAARGPRMRLPPGRYRARLDAGVIEGEGLLRMIVTTDDKKVVVAEATFSTATPPAERPAFFDITKYGVDDVEIVCRSEGLDAVTIHGLSIDTELPEIANTPFPWLTALAPGALDGPSSDSRTPPFAIRPGRYVAAVDCPAAADAGDLTLRATTDAGSRTITMRRVIRPAGEDARYEWHFDITADGVRDLVLSCSGPGLQPSTGIGVVIAQRGRDSLNQAFPRFYDAQSLRVGNGLAHYHRIMSNGQDGVLCFGPYVDLEEGLYIAQVHIGGDLPKILSVTVTGRVGDKRIAGARFDRQQLNGGAVVVPFEIPSEGMPAVEVVCDVRQAAGMFVTGVTIEKR